MQSTGISATDTVRAWKPPIPGVREVLHARFGDHAYPLHTHDSWTLFIVDDGSIRYDLEGRDRGAGPGRASVLPPYVVHDGRPGGPAGYRKRVLYLEPAVLGEGLIGPAVDRPDVPDPAVGSSVAAVHDALERADDALEAETRLAFVTERIRASFGTLPPVGAQDTSCEGELAEALRAWLDARLTEPVTMAAASAALEASPTRLARAFSTTFGIAPHAYLLGRRLDAARDRILEGDSLADVAAAVGFFDQAHLTHRFKRFLGVTPGEFAHPHRDAIASPDGAMRTARRRPQPAYRP